MKSNTLIFLFIATIFINNNVAAQKAVTPQNFNPIACASSSGIDTKKAESIDSLLQSFVDNNKLNCVAAFVAQRGNVVYKKAFGLKDIENQVPATIDDYYVMFSQTKAITTVAFMTLVDKGLVSIDDPVSKFFPEISNLVVTKVNGDGTYETRPVKTQMTFAHLMSHSSGLNAGLVGEIRRAEAKSDGAPAGFGGPVPDKKPNGQRTFGGNFDSKYLKEEMLALAKYPLGFDPGTEWNYHISTNMLGYMVERISGKSLREYVKETILIPLGMENTDWYYQPEALARFVKPYIAVEGKLNPGQPCTPKQRLVQNKLIAKVLSGSMVLLKIMLNFARCCSIKENLTAIVS